MKKLYTTLAEVLIESGYDVAVWGEDSYETTDRSVRIDMVEQSQIAPEFDMYTATFNVVFLHGDWALNAAKLSDALMTFIPMYDRQDKDSKQLPDNTTKLTLLEVPQFSDIISEYDTETAEEEHSVSVTIYYHY